MYAGTLYTFRASPFLLGWWWALAAAAANMAVLVTRTALEDRTLQRALPGYRDYAGEVRFRLVPGIR